MHDTAKPNWVPVVREDFLSISFQNLVCVADAFVMQLMTRFRDNPVVIVHPEQNSQAPITAREGYGFPKGGEANRDACPSLRTTAAEDRTRRDCRSHTADTMKNWVDCVFRRPGGQAEETPLTTRCA